MEVVMAEEITYSPFATMIRRMLDESNLSTREEWRVVLTLQRHEIDILTEWTTDGLLPSPRDLRSLIDVLTYYNGVPPQLLADIHAFLDQPMKEVTPLFAKRGDPLLVGWTVGQYAEAPVLEGLLSMLHTLPAQERNLMFDRMRDIIDRACDRASA